MHKSGPFLPIGSLHSRAAAGRGYRPRGQHSWAEHAHCGSVDPKIISWVDRTPQRWQKQACSSFAAARLHAKRCNIGGGKNRRGSRAPLPQPCPSRPDCNPLVRDSRYLPCEEKFVHASEIFLPRGAFGRIVEWLGSGWFARSRRRRRTIGQALRAGQMASAHVRT